MCAYVCELDWYVFVGMCWIALAVVNHLSAIVHLSVYQCGRSKGVVFYLQSISSAGKDSIQSNERLFITSALLLDLLRVNASSPRTSLLVHTIPHRFHLGCWGGLRLQPFDML